jgi:putative transposase
MTTTTFTDLITDESQLRDVFGWPSERSLNKQIERLDQHCRAIIFGEGALRHALQEYVEHYQRVRPHQGKNNVLLMPAADDGQLRDGPVRCRERLGGLLHYYDREAA